MEDIEPEVGKRYVIDAGFANSSVVELVSRDSHYCWVRDPETGYEWETMVYRLSKVTEKERA